MHAFDLRESRLHIDENRIAVFEHMRPAARNALSMHLRSDYADMLDLVEEHGARALVLTGSGGSFCAGGDVKTMHERQALGTQTSGVRKRLLDMHQWLQRLRDLEIPVIAAVDGPAWGGGFAIALCADFVLATPQASFCMAFLRVGALPDMGVLHLLPRAIGLQKAKELLMTGRRVDVPEAERLGIVLSTHEPDVLLQEAKRYAERFLGASRVALGMTKRLANKAYETDPATMAELEAVAQVVCLSEPEHAEAIARFSRKESIQYDWDRVSKK